MTPEERNQILRRVGISGPMEDRLNGGACVNADEVASALARLDVDALAEAANKCGYFGVYAALSGDTPLRAGIAREYAIALVRSLR